MRQDYVAYNFVTGRSQWLRGLRRKSAAALMQRLWVANPKGTWKFVCCERCLFSDRVLCVGLITRPEKSYLVWCVFVCDLETSRIRSIPKRSTEKKNSNYIVSVFIVITLMGNYGRDIVVCLQRWSDNWRPQKMTASWKQLCHNKW